MTSTETYSFTVNNEDHLSKLPRRIKRPFWYCGIHLSKKTFGLGTPKSFIVLRSCSSAALGAYRFGFCQSVAEKFSGTILKGFVDISTLIPKQKHQAIYW